MRKLLFTLAFTVFSTASALAQSNSTDFKPHASFSGQLFADYYYILSADTSGPPGKFYYEPNSHTPNSATDNTKNYQAFDIRRVQFGANYYYSKNITAKVLLEHESGYANGDVLSNNKIGFYAKEANISFGGWIPMADIIFGQQVTHLFSVDEALMGYRGAEKSLLDMRGMTETGSNDLGIQAIGNFDPNKDFGYSVLLANSDNSSKVEDMRDKVIAGEVNASLLNKHIILDLAADYGGMPTATSGLDSGYAQSNSLWKIMAAYTSEPFTVGFVYANHTLAGQSKSVAGVDVNQRGLSFFAHGQIIPKGVNAFVRYDMLDPDSKANDNLSGRKESFILAGLDWLPDGEGAPNVHVVPNIEINSFMDKSPANVSYAPITVLRLTFFDKF